ncbi:phage tail protein [Eubacteriales bacterium OttesenSCG-928-N13]|nr:phage tail protein [Eubacteriales bacterium OttesenSCG-928-N13]
MSEPIASPAVSSTVGIKNVVLAALTEDTEATLSYDALQLLAGAIDVQIAPQNAEPDVQYFDDTEGSVVYPDPEIKVTMEQADIPLLLQEKILGNTIDENGVLIRRASDSPPYFALGFKSEKSDGSYRYVWLYKGRATPLTEQYHTKEGKTVTRQTGKIEWTFIKRTHDGEYQALADDGQNGFSPAKAATFLQSVYQPVYAAP